MKNATYSTKQRITFVTSSLDWLPILACCTKILQCIQIAVTCSRQVLMCLAEHSLQGSDGRHHNSCFLMLQRLAMLEADVSEPAQQELQVRRVSQVRRQSHQDLRHS